MSVEHIPIPDGCCNCHYCLGCSATDDISLPFMPGWSDGTRCNCSALNREYILTRDQSCRWYGSFWGSCLGLPASLKDIYLFLMKPASVWYWYLEIYPIGAGFGIYQSANVSLCKDLLPATLNLVSSGDISPDCLGSWPSTLNIDGA